MTRLNSIINKAQSFLSASEKEQIKQQAQEDAKKASELALKKAKERAEKRAKQREDDLVATAISILSKADLTVIEGASDLEATCEEGYTVRVIPKEGIQVFYGNGSPEEINFGKVYHIESGSPQYRDNEVTASAVKAAVELLNGYKKYDEVDEYQRGQTCYVYGPPCFLTSFKEFSSFKEAVKFARSQGPFSVE